MRQHNMVFDDRIIVFPLSNDAMLGTLHTSAFFLMAKRDADTPKAIVLKTLTWLSLLKKKLIRSNQLSASIVAGRTVCKDHNLLQPLFPKCCPVNKQWHKVKPTQEASC